MDRRPARRQRLLSQLLHETEGRAPITERESVMLRADLEAFFIHRLREEGFFVRISRTSEWMIVEEPKSKRKIAVSLYDIEDEIMGLRPGDSMEYLIDNIILRVSPPRTLKALPRFAAPVTRIRLAERARHE